MIHNIQLLRFLCAFAVVIAHLILFGSKKYGLNAPFGDIFSYYLMSGVDIFFIISGFVMVHTRSITSSKNHKKNSFKNNFKSFFVKRIARIYPIWWLLCLSLLPVFLLFPSLINSSVEAPTSFLHSLFLIPHEGVPLIVVGWTLEYELFFYFVFGLTLFLSRTKQIMAVSALFIGSIIAGFVYGATNHPLLIIATSPFLLYFIIGMISAQIYREKDYQKYFIFVGIGSLILSIVYTFSFEIGEIARVTHLLPMATSIFILFLGLEKSGKHSFNKFYIWGGDISYPLYLSHILVISFVGKITSYLNIEFSYLIALLVIVICIVTSHILWVMYDRPIQKYIKKVMSK